MLNKFSVQFQLLYSHFLYICKIAENNAELELELKLELEGVLDVVLV